MLLLNKIQKFEFAKKTKYYVPACNVNGYDIEPLTREQMANDKECDLHKAAPHSGLRYFRKYRKDGDVAVITTAKSAVNYNYSSYQPYEKLKASYEASNKILLWLMENKEKINSLRDFMGEEVIRDRREFGCWEMKGYKGFPISSIKNSNIIDPPRRIRYAKMGKIEEDCCWWDGKVLTVLSKGTEIEYSIN